MPRDAGAAAADRSAAEDSNEWLYVISQNSGSADVAWCNEVFENIAKGDISRARVLFESRGTALGPCPEPEHRTVSRLREVIAAGGAPSHPE